MAVELNHTIVKVRDKHAAAAFYIDILGLPPATQDGPFVAVAMSNDTTLDFADEPGTRVPTHYAFRVSETEFDEILARIKGRGIDYFADPFHHQPGEIDLREGGRGVYWDDPDGNALEILTAP
jgi:catechol 2,3-dioxygenase-like lactoylglutathione lyase family enzyme